MLRLWTQSGCFLRMEDQVWRGGALLVKKLKAIEGDLIQFKRMFTNIFVEKNALKNLMLFLVR